MIQVRPGTPTTAAQKNHLSGLLANSLYGSQSFIFPVLNFVGRKKKVSPCEAKQIVRTCFLLLLVVPIALQRAYTSCLVASLVC